MVVSKVGPLCKCCSFGPACGDTEGMIVGWLVNLAPQGAGRDSSAVGTCELRFVMSLTFLSPSSLLSVYVPPSWNSLDV